MASTINFSVSSIDVEFDNDSVDASWKCHLISKLLIKNGLFISSVIHKSLLKN